MEDSPVKVEGASTRHRAGYKSWKKKYRKMRIVFDQKMHDGEELHKQEDKAAALVKRLAVENDRLLDILLEINNSPAIPFDKRIDLSLKPSTEAGTPVLPLDKAHDAEKESSLKRLTRLVADIPHSSYSQAKNSLPAVVQELQPPEGEAHTADFLSADDIDNYIYDLDTHLDPDARFPSLAPRAHPNDQQASNHHLKNPTSVTNWLRKHAPKVFLQDGETHNDTEDGDGTHTTGRKPRGERGSRGGRGSGRGKRASAARAAAAERREERVAGAGGDWDASMDDDVDLASTPAPRGKRKRNNEDDAGYKPRGSSTRPTKKKRKSDVDGTPIAARKTKKEKEAAAAAAAAVATVAAGQDD